MTTYEAACEAHTEATKVYWAALATFRAGGSYEAFFAAKAAYDAATAIYDAAYEIASNIPEEVEAEAVEEDTQLALFA